jgi:hypothetical protein
VTAQKMVKGASFQAATIFEGLEKDGEGRYI